MSDNTKWLDWAVELQSLAQAGLQYSQNEFELERYARIRDIAAEMVAGGSGLPLEKVKDIFCCEKGYQTPKIDVRAAIIENGKILLVKERDGLWAMPGGWADIGYSVAENACKEALEEAGADVEPLCVVAVQDWGRNNNPGKPAALTICKVFILCAYWGGGFMANLETIESGWFTLKDLPELHTKKNTRAQIELCFEAEREGNWVTVFD